MGHCTFISEKEYLRGPDSDQWYYFTSTLELRKDHTFTVTNRNWDVTDIGIVSDEKTVFSGTFGANTDGKSFAFQASSKEEFNLLSKDPEGKTTKSDVVEEAKLEFGKDGLKMKIALPKFYWAHVWGDVPVWLKHEYPTIPWPN